MNRILLLLMLASLAWTGSIGRYRPTYLECIDSSDCPGFECCVFAHSKENTKGFSIPRCRPLLALWSKCDSTQSTSSNHSARYPDSIVPVTYTNIYYSSCPCEQGLVCDMSNVCVDPIDRQDFNDLNNI